MPRFRVVIYLLFIICSPAIKAGDSLSITQIPSVVPTNLSYRLPDENYFKRYLIDNDYNYGQDFKNPDDINFFGRLLEYLASMIKRSLYILRYMPVLLKVLFFISCVILLYIMVTQTKLYKLFYSNKEIINPEFSEVSHLDENFDFDLAISNQVAQQNFRNAIRLLHLKMLKELEIYKLIVLSGEKTNREYGYEIKDQYIRRSFFNLSAVYNRIWYGNNYISKEEYEIFASDFKQFSTGLDVKEK